MSGHQALDLKGFFRFLLVTLVLCAVIGQPASAGPGDEQKGRFGVSMEAPTVNFAELAADQLRNDPACGGGAATAGSTTRKRASTRPVEARRDGAVTDALLSATGAGADGAGSTTVITAASGPSSPPPSASFVALLDNAVAFNPDTQGAVGPEHLMVTLGSEVRIQNRAGGVLSTVSLDAFWGSLGNSNVFDPRVLYDSANQRWIFTAVSNPATNNSHLLVGISQTSDPTGNWFRHGVRVDDIDGVYASSPTIGLSRDWITIQANMLDQTGLFFFSCDIFTFNKTNLYAGGPANYRRFYHFPAGMPPGVPPEVGTPVPMVSFDDSTSTNFLVANVGVLGGLGRLRVFTISGPVDDPVYDERDQAFYVAAGPAFGSPTWADNPVVIDNFAPQLGTTNRIFVGDARMQNAVFRNGLIWAAHQVFLPTNAPNRVSVQWWCFTPGGSVLQHGRIDDPSAAKMYAYPSLAVNRYEDVLIGYTRFAANQYPSANYAFHSYQDGPGRLRSDTVLKAGESKFTVADNGLILWGDWSGTMVDPINDTDLWTIQEYASAPVNGIERWGTWWGRVSPETNLRIQASGSANPLVAGNEIVYSIQVTNLSGHTATGVRITNSLPAGAVFVSASVPQGSCTESNGTVVCMLGDLPGDPQEDLVFGATIVARLNQAGTATNRVSVFGYSVDESPTDNSAVITTTVTTAADVAVTLSATPSPAILNNNVTYSLTVTNRGPSAAGSVFLTNTLPSGVTFLSVSSTLGSCNQSGGRVTCSFGALAARAGAAITIVGRAIALGAQTDGAVVTSSSVDPEPGNNAASVVVIGNTLPTLQAVSNRTITEDSVLGPIPFSVNDAETPLDSLVLAAYSSNPAIVPPENIVMVGSGSSRTLTVTPLPNANGAITITRTLADLDGSVVSNSFVLTVNAVNDPPTITDIASQTINEDAVLGPIGIVVSDVETPAGSLTVSGASSNPGLIPNASIQFGGSGSNRAVRIFPTTNQSGTATITLTVSDGALTTSDTFVVTVVSLNDLPVISDIANQVIAEDGSTSVIPFSVSDVETAAGSLSVVATSSNPVLVPNANITLAGTGANRTVAARPASNQFGVATITITVRDADNGTSSDSFVLTVAAVNDSPTLDPLPPLSILEDAGPQTVRLSGVGTGASNELDTLSINVKSSNPGLIPSPGVVTYNGTATNSFAFTPAANSNGTATLTVIIDDRRSSNNVVVRSFLVTVAPVNDPPLVFGLTDRSIPEDGTTGPIPFTVSDIETTPAALVVFGSSSNTNLVPASRIAFGGTGSNRTVTVTPLPDQFGSSIITVFVRDAAATNSAQFVLSVDSVNDVPTISPITNRIIDEDGVANVAFTVSDKETSMDSLIASARASNPALISSFEFGGSGSNRFLVLRPVPDASGSATITVTVTDADGGSAGTSFAFSVRPVNDLPTLDPVPDLIIDEDAPGQVIPLTGISTGAANEVQPLSVSVLSSNGAILTNIVVTYVNGSSAGRIDFVPVRDASGTALLTVLVSDGVSTRSRVFAVTIRPVNDLPEIAALANVEIDEDTTAVVAVKFGDRETAASELLIHVQSSNPELLDGAGVVIDGTGTNRLIRLTPIADRSGATTVVSVSVEDGDGGTVTTTFELKVRPVNDVPTISGLSALTMDEDAPATVVPFLISDAESLPASLAVMVDCSNPVLFPAGNLALGGTGFERRLSLMPAANEFGTAVVSVVVNDGRSGDGLAATNRFTVTVSAVNDPPTLDSIPSLVLPLDAGVQVVTLSGISMGVSNEGQTLAVLAESNDAAVVPQPAVSYTSPGAVGTLSIVPGGIGTATVTVSVVESGGVLQGGTNVVERQFTVTIGGTGPSLLVNRVDGFAVISWSTNSPVHWTLESSTNVAAADAWTAVLNPPGIVDGRYSITNVVEGVTRYYRLRNR